MPVSPRIPVPGTYNFREPGGYPAEAGMVRPGKLFRSDGLHSLGDDGRAELSLLGVRTVIDLRDDFEASAQPDALDGLDLEVVRLPVFEGRGSSDGTNAIALSSLYERVVTEHSEVVVEALRRIAGSGDAAVLVHCTAGKDRTGIVVALALLAVGVDRALVVEDYAASQSNLDGAWLNEMLALIARYGVEETPELRVLLGGSPPEVLDDMLDVIEERHGSIHKYLLASGLSQGDLARLQRVLVETPDLT
ncbi:tyrosine-protein phosphatase [Glaciibacter superstes]|uniref:tyrosine-protein phosphatase n=1 Tax=Glaciibacter superstes TaxID=501023 RepID=UPI0003B35E80|nr:tyrosine-protein phosphatase [Glaciibacter superstes]